MTEHRGGKKRIFPFVVGTVDDRLFSEKREPERREWVLIVP
jgi:hypothetical protein